MTSAVCKYYHAGMQCLAGGGGQCMCPCRHTNARSTCKNKLTLQELYTATQINDSLQHLGYQGKICSKTPQINHKNKQPI